jgi:hypothetical protein
MTPTHSPRFGRRRFFLCLATPVLILSAALSPAAAQTGFPFSNDEALHYSITWPSGLSLGDARFTAHHSDRGWDFDVTIDAAIPGFAIRDHFLSTATAGLCSTSVSRDTSHGAKKGKEKTTFDAQKNTAHRVTEVPAEGGYADFSVPACARDAVTFIYFARKELGQGRVPAAQQIYLGSGYSVKMEYTGAQNVTLADKKPEMADHVLVTVTGPKANFTVEVFYARDAARTPLLIKIPNSAGALTVELVR